MPVDRQPTLKVSLQQSRPISLDANFECSNAELLALTGPSGSGKTTVLRAIAGLHRVTRGRIVCNNKLWQDGEKQLFVSPQQRRVGLVFQHYALFPHLTVLENVTTAMSHVTRNHRAGKAMEWLRLTNMEGLHKQQPHRLSGGQRQRVALARALAREPDVLLLDEPFSAVDQLTREKLYRELAQIRATLNVPMILVTHDMLEVQQLADSLCLMHHGKTMQTGPVTQVMRKPDNARIARLLGHKNLYAGLYQRQRQHGTLDILGTQLQVGNLMDASSRVDALITPSAIIMHRTDKPSNGERENPIVTRVVESVELGDELSMKLLVEATGDTIAFRVSRHVAMRNKVVIGGKLVVSILPEGIHLMPAYEHNQHTLTQQAPVAETQS